MAYPDILTFCIYNVIGSAIFSVTFFLVWFLAEVLERLLGGQVEPFSYPPSPPSDGYGREQRPRNDDNGAGRTSIFERAESSPRQNLPGQGIVNDVGGSEQSPSLASEDSHRGPTAVSSNQTRHVDPGIVPDNGQGHYHHTNQAPGGLPELRRNGEAQIPRERGNQLQNDPLNEVREYGTGRKFTINKNGIADHQKTLSG